MLGGFLLRRVAHDRLSCFWMDTVAAVLSTLSIGNWIAIAALSVTFIGLCFTAANYLAGRRERKLRTYETTPDVKASINRKRYAGGWRSVQLHIVARLDHEQNFNLAHWYIDRAKLLRPWSAVLARAKGDDYASGEFFPENPVREIEGRREGRPQRFALEFFIKFKGDDKGKEAKFKVGFSHAVKSRHSTVRVRAIVPLDAE